MLCYDINVLSLLMGMASAGHLLGDSAGGTGNEAQHVEAFLRATRYFAKSRKPTFLLAISWKVPELGDLQISFLNDPRRVLPYKVYIEAVKLADVFHKLCRTMFHFEDESIVASHSETLDQAL
jgi:hypothetical protein